MAAAGKAEADEITDDDDVDEMDVSDTEDPFLEDERAAEARETAAEKRLRLAKKYIESMEEGMRAEGGFDAAEVDRELLSERLRDEVVRAFRTAFLA